MKFIILQIVCAIFGAALGFAFGRLHRSVRRSGVQFSGQSGGAYIEIDEVIESERERIRAGQVCTDKTHWH